MIGVKVDLTNGRWAEFRALETLNAGDRLAIRRTQKVPTDDIAGHEIIGSWKDDMRVVLLSRVIVGWNYDGWPVPSMTPDPMAAIEQLPIDDYDILSVEIEPWLEKVDHYPSPKTSGESTSTSED